MYQIPSNFRCPKCTRDAPTSLQTNLRRMNEHMKRAHEHSGLTIDEFLQLESCQAWKPGSNKSSFQAIEVLDHCPQGNDFRHESVLEMKLGLLGSNIMFCEGEEQQIRGSDCRKYFNVSKPNPFQEEALIFLDKARLLCKKAGSSHCRQQALRDSQGCVSHNSFRPVQNVGSMKKYAKTLANLIFFATKVPGHESSNLQAFDAILHSLFFEPYISIGQTFLTRYMTVVITTGDMVLYHTSPFKQT